MNTVRYCVLQTDYGWAGLAGSQAGINRLILPKESADAVLNLLGATKDLIDESAFGDLPQRLKRYFAGYAPDFPDRLDFTRTTAFQIEVWRVTQAIPYGQTESYGWIADRIGRPNAAHAVGRALGANRIPIIIPCHRVIAGDGSLSGFSGGIEMKKLLLTIENKAK